MPHTPGFSSGGWWSEPRSSCSRSTALLTELSAQPLGWLFLSMFLYSEGVFYGMGGGIPLLYFSGRVLLRLFFLALVRPAWTARLWEAGAVCLEVISPSSHRPHLSCCYANSNGWYICFNALFYFFFILFPYYPFF